MFSYDLDPTKNTLLSIAISFLAFLILQKIVKRVWNRKRCPPGPRGLPIVGYIPFLGSQPHITIHNLRKKYGDIIGLNLGTNYTVFLNDYSSMKEVYSNPASSDRNNEQFTHLTDFGFGSENGKPWIEQRKFCMLTMKDLGVGKSYFEEVVQEEVESFLEYLKDLDGKPTDISSSLRNSIASNIIAFLIGRKLDKIKEADIIQLSLDFNQKVFENSGTTSALYNVPGLAKLYQFLGIGGFDKVKSIMKEFNDFFKNEIKNHKMSNFIGSRDFITLYLEELNKEGRAVSEKYFSEGMLLGNTIVLFSGGSDTTFTSIDWVLRMMTEYKDVQNKVFEELKKNLGQNGKAKYEDRDSIPYTCGVVMETLRFSGFITIPGNRLAIDDIPVKGYIIPKGSQIATNIWAIHNDPSYWDEPQKFMPERFLSEDGTKLLKNPPAYVPFSIGRRNCPGTVIAWMEVLSYFTEIIKNFEVSLAPGEKNNFRTVDGLVGTLLPQKICFKHRN